MLMWQLAVIKKPMQIQRQNEQEDHIQRWFPSLFWCEFYCERTTLHHIKSLNRMLWFSAFWETCLLMCKCHFVLIYSCTTLWQWFHKSCLDLILTNIRSPLQFMADEVRPFNWYRKHFINVSWHFHLQHIWQCCLEPELLLCWESPGRFGQGQAAVLCSLGDQICLAVAWHWMEVSIGQIRADEGWKSCLDWRMYRK